MTIVLHEIKKVFGLRMVIMLLAINVVFYFLFIQFYFQHFPNGNPDTEIHKASIEMKKDYGTHMDNAEYELFRQKYDETIEKAEQFMKTDQQFMDAGITTYEQFYNSDYNNEQLNKLHNYAVFESDTELFWELQARRYMIERYENSEKYPYNAYGEVDAKQQNRMEKHVASDEGDSIFTDVVFSNYMSLIIYMTVLIGLSILFMVSPIFLHDKRSKLIHLQYTARIGRRLFLRKLTAAMISTLLIVTVQLGVFFLMYSRLGTGLFLDSGINSIFNIGYFWYDLTFGQYIGLTVAAIYALSLITAVFAAWISSIAPNYMVIIGLQIPYAFLMFGWMEKLLIGRLADIYYAQHVQPLTYLLLAAGAVLLFVLRWRSERRADLLV
ncbi:hypothetical protein BK120_09645 [Paenibacillus sp. FSL A5-0031]|uniref:hypothetical protein n=1 Tax=unclassified Paenibacillus TaxID=185978 RepID=UPI00096DB9F1|nr:hypothetical protein [Paenibacillus sp. FSL A5-0031]OME86220.1 hypothetical protein BK120_09645 [Paenibacillus sp. FSL A5-0031]